MKIKTKKQLNLPQLIEWAWENKIKSHIIRAEKQLMNIQFDEYGDFRTYGFTGIDTTFTIEVEEEINRETELKLVERYVFVGEENNPKYMTHYPRSLNSILESNPSEVITTHFYTEVNDDLVLIWRDGKLVE